MPAMNIATYTNYTTSDYNGLRSGESAPSLISWRSPANGVPRDYESEFEPQLFPSIAQFSRATGNDAHSVLVDYDDFRNVPLPDESRPHVVLPLAGLDFSLLRRSRAVDAGDRMPNINDDYEGDAPDLGALEFGAPVPIYGPRPR